MTIKIKYILISIVLVALVIGIYYFVNFQMKMKDAIIATQSGQTDVINFLRQQFPDQVKAYIEAQKALSVNPTTK